MDIEPEQVKTEPPEDAGLCEELEIELGPVKYENGQVPADRDSLKCGEVKVEPTLTVEHGMQLPSDMAGPAVTIKEEPQDLEEADDFAEPGDVDFEGVKIKNEPAEPEEKEEEPVPSSSSVSGKHICNKCGGVYGTKRGLSLHIRAHSKNPLRRYNWCSPEENAGDARVSSSRSAACSLCDYRSKFVDSVESHFLRCHSDENHFQCKLCTQKFKTKKGLKLHVTREHSEKSYPCTLCTFKSASLASLRSHEANCHGFNCTKCDFKCSGRLQMSKHNRAQHQPPRLFECYLCSYKTYNRRGISKHVMLHISIFWCTKCDFKCSSRSEFRNHNKYQHPHLYECYRCRFKTNDRRRIVPHLKTHMRKLVFQCRHCGNPFTTSTYRNYHERTQHSSKFTFFSMDSL